MSTGISKHRSTSTGLCTRKLSLSTATAPGPANAASSTRGSRAPAVPAVVGQPELIEMIQWCDGPTPSANRPAHATCVVSACCAIDHGMAGLDRDHRCADLDALDDLAEQP